MSYCVIVLLFEMSFLYRLNYWKIVEYHVEAVTTSRVWLSLKEQNTVNHTNCAKTVKHHRMIISSLNFTRGCCNARR